ncbi:hypothetical protein B484DRAFT_392486, partial [Ochromonadaceae sp. CCMP2298]
MHLIRPSGVPVASGSVPVLLSTLPHNPPSAPHTLFQQQQLTLPLTPSRNIEDWTPPPELGPLPPLSISAGCVLTHGRLPHLHHPSGASPTATRVTQALSPAPSLQLCLGAVLGRAGGGNQEFGGGGGGSGVEDLQLTSDMLDLYADRHLVLTAGLGGLSSLQPHCYLGHSACNGAVFAHQAQLDVPLGVGGGVGGGYLGYGDVKGDVDGDIGGLGGSEGASALLRCCLNLEVKVMQADP